MRITLSSFAIFLVILASGCGGCSSTPNGNSGDATVDAPPLDLHTSSGTLRVVPSAADLELDAAGVSSTEAFSVFLTPTGSATENDVTADATFFLDDPTLAAITLNSVGSAHHGGSSTIRVSAHGASTTIPIHVQLKGQLILSGASSDLPTRFSTGTLDSTASALPRIEYPLASAVVPNNVPPMLVQWTQAADNSAYRVQFRSGADVDVSVFTTSREALAPLDLWHSITQSVRDASLEMIVEGLSDSGQLRQSAPVSITVASDRIDDSSIYYWESSSGSFRVLDFATGANRTLPSDSPAIATAASGGTCVACHSVSRDGRRYAYTTANFQYGLLRLDSTSATTNYARVVEPGDARTVGKNASHGAFNPIEDSTRPAFLQTTGDIVERNTAGHVRLELIDPDTGATVPSNLEEFIASLPESVGHDVLIPDWSDDGHVVVFSAYDSEWTGTTATRGGGGGEETVSAHVRLLSDDAVAASIVEAAVDYNPTTMSFTFSSPHVLVQSPEHPSFDLRENNLLPALSPDVGFVAFTRANGWWPIRFQEDATNNTGRIGLVRRTDGATIELLRASGEPLDDSTWPQWAPTMGARYAWLAFSSSRPYGHLMAPGVAVPASCIPQGHTLCKQMWVTAVDLSSARAELLSDPSSVPFWIPGQNVSASAVSPRWTVRVIPLE